MGRCNNTKPMVDAMPIDANRHGGLHCQMHVLHAALPPQNSKELPQLNDNVARPCAIRSMNQSEHDSMLSRLPLNSNAAAFSSPFVLQTVRNKFQKLRLLVVRSHISTLLACQKLIVVTICCSGMQLRLGLVGAAEKNRNLCNAFIQPVLDTMHREHWTAINK